MPANPRFGVCTGPRVSLAVLLFMLAALARIIKPVPPASLVLTANGPAAGALITHPDYPGQSVITNQAGEYRLPVRDKSGWMIALENHYLANTGPGAIRLDPVPPDHADTPWIDPTPGTSPQACGSCHQETYRQWQGSPHHLAAQSPLFSALIQPDGHSPWHMGATYPEAQAACVACHSPGASALEAELPGQGPLAGVHCDFCHKISGFGSGTPGLTHGRDLFNLARPAPNARPVVIGPLPNSRRENVAYSPLYKQSLFCAPCHEGTVLGTPVYTTFSEWTAWAGTESCQDCHMPADGPRRHHHAMALRKNCVPGGLRASWSVQTSPKGPVVEMTLQADRVGHALPTGHIDRHILGWLEVFDAAGKPVLVDNIPGTLPAWAIGQPKPVWGFLLARWREKGLEGPVPFWSPEGEIRDTRLLPGQSRAMEWPLPPEARSVRLRIEHRKAWPAMLRAHQLSLPSAVLLDETRPVVSEASGR